MLGIPTWKTNSFEGLSINPQPPSLQVYGIIQGLPLAFGLLVMDTISMSCFLGALLLGTALGAPNPGPAPAPLSFNKPSGYSTKVYNVSAATTTLTYHYSNEELGLLWDQVGPISVGPITTTVSPTPEPSSYPRPGALHRQVCPIPRLLSARLTGTGTNL